MAKLFLTSASLVGLSVISFFMWHSRKRRKQRKLAKTKQIAIHSAVVGHLVGESGLILKDIVEKSGAEIHFICDDASPEYIVCQIDGEEGSVRLAQDIIYRILKRCGEVNFDTHSEGNIFKNEIDYEELKRISSELSKSLNDSSPTIVAANEDTEVDMQVASLATSYTIDHTQKLYSLSDDGHIPVYISAVANPNIFWVQAIKTKEHIELDRLTEDLSEFYKTHPEWSRAPDFADVKPGFICATYFTDDEKWYRAEVCEISPENENNRNDTTVDLYFLDYGISSYQKVKNIRRVPPQFLNLKFQAIECGLSHIIPRDDTWSDEAISVFEELTRVAQWVTYMARIDYEDEKGHPQVSLIDATSEKDLNIADELVRRGFAKYSFI